MNSGFVTGVSSSPKLPVGLKIGDPWIGEMSMLEPQYFALFMRKKFDLGWKVLLFGTWARHNQGSLPVGDEKLLCWTEQEWGWLCSAPQQLLSLPCSKSSLSSLSGQHQPLVVDWEAPAPSAMLS